MQKIVKNMIKCKKCGDVIQSRSRHDFRFCDCGAISIDGGYDYLKRSFQFSADDIEEMSIVEEVKE